MHVSCNRMLSRWTPERLRRPPMCRRWPVLCQDDRMGSDGSKARKKTKHLPKVPKYEEPNQLEGAQGGTSFGRAGHGSDHHHYDKPAGFGAWVLKVLGKKPNP